MRQLKLQIILPAVLTLASQIRLENVKTITEGE